MPILCRAPEGNGILKVLADLGFFQVQAQRNFFPPHLGHEATLALPCSAASFFPFGEQTMPAPSALQSLLVRFENRLTKLSYLNKGLELGRKMEGCIQC